MAHDTEWIFGIDGGGTNSRIRVETRDGTLLFSGTGGSTNPNSNSRERVGETLESLISDTISGARLDTGRCTGGFIGSAGIDFPEDAEPYIAMFREYTGLRCPLFAGNDAEPALAGALGEPEGIILVAGTGSIALARLADGTCVRAGGWGHFLGDEGSAFWIAFQGIIRGMRSVEGRDLPSGLLPAALADFRLASERDLIPLVYADFSKSRIAGFARTVARLGGEGDRLASDIMKRAVGELAALAASVHDSLGSRLKRKRLAFRGGLIEANDFIREGVKREIIARLPGIEIVEGGGDAVQGACILARAMTS